ncbi:MAG TPA: NAD-dependent epimerase/dehydratase family protein [Trebonia sp.]|jgi:2'-hydroxyisoflavone reductase|nr:NAD-dependent epimerase/dehydratase family protein [Trebonia sp.]
MRILILGGTKFLGRALTEAALGRGDIVTLFNRGRTNPGLYPGVETVTGDRAGDLSGVAGRDWDAVIDVAGYDPEVVRLSARELARNTGRYVFVSTCSVYADQTSRAAQLEDAPVAQLREGLTEPWELYGPRKALAEQIVRDVYGDRALIPRPGLIVGPHDPTDRFPYWPRRIARGGVVLAPGSPEDQVQFIDARDLAAWTIDGVHHGRAGTFNLVGNPWTFRKFLEECIAATYSDTHLRWIPGDALIHAGVSPDMGIPLWIGDPEEARGFNDVSNARAVAAGLTLRPVAGTIRDTLAWDAGRGGPEPGQEGLSAAAEERLLRELAG